MVPGPAPVALGEAWAPEGEAWAPGTVSRGSPRRGPSSGGGVETGFCFSGLCLLPASDHV
jgi:hypothetical protein